MQKDKEGVYQFRFRGKQLRIFLFYVLSVFFLTFVLGYLVGKYSIPKTDWLVRASLVRASKEIPKKENNTKEVGSPSRPPGGKSIQEVQPNPPPSRTSDKTPKPSPAAVKTSLETLGKVLSLTKENPTVPPTAQKLPETRRGDGQAQFQKENPSQEPPIAAIEIQSEPVGNKNGLSALKSVDRSDQEIKSSAKHPSENEGSNLDRQEPSNDQPLSPVKTGSVQVPDTEEKSASPKLANNSDARPDGPILTRVMTPSLKPEPVPTHMGFSTKPSTGKLKPGQANPEGGVQPSTPSGVDGNGTKTGLKNRAATAPLPQYRYYVQIGSFLELEEAERKKEELRKNSYPAFIRQANLGAKENQYRVLISSNHLDLESVTEEAKRLSKQLNLTTHIFKDK